MSEQKRIAFGFDRDANNEIIINEGQAIIVEVIYAYYLAGSSLSEIKDVLEKTGVPSPHNGRTWSRQTLANILSNPHYLGSDVYPPLISKEDFDKVQDIKSSK